MGIPFTKAQAVGNDFIIVEQSDLCRAGLSENLYSAFSRSICDRRYGVGADGLEILLESSAHDEFDRAVRIFNSDGSEAEISGNGTRCVAATLMAAEESSKFLRISTQAGVKTLRLLQREGCLFQFEMSMGRPRYKKDEINCTIETTRGEKVVSILDVGNPQCVFQVEDFDWDWQVLGREIGTHSRFRTGTNVSFVKRIGRHTIEVRFWERGVGETASSGTGSTGAAVGAILSGVCDNPVRVVTTAGDLELRWEDEVILTGPATIVFRGEYWYG